MLTRSPSVSNGTKPDNTETMIAVIAVIRYGVPNVGWTLARPTGSSPSRAIAKATRV